MNDYAQIVAKIRNTPWLILPESLEVILGIVDSRVNGERLSEDEIKMRLSSTSGTNRTRIGAEAGGGVGLLPLYGPIFPKANMMTEMSGATSLETFRNEFRALMANDLVGSIVLDIDSPGGVSDLVPEMGAEIRSARETKPIYAVANTQAGSAAFWLGSQATKFYVTPSGSVGSIGVYSVHEDHSVEDTKDGIKTTYISAGPYKVEGNPHEPLSDEALAHRQGVVDALYTSFLQEVATGRGVSVETVKGKYGKGRMVLSGDALDAGMVDGIMTLDSVLGQLLTANGTNKGVKSGTLAFAMNERQMVSNVDMEHSEPGSADPPIPREVPIERDTTEGWRRDTPPNPDVTSASEGGNVVDRTQLIAYAEKLGITGVDDTITDEKLASLVSSELDNVMGEVTPLRDAVNSANATKSFRESYPEEYARMQSLEATDRENKASSFAHGFARFTRMDGDKVIPDTKGFSSLVQTKIESFHMSLNQGVASTEDFAEVLNAIAGGGIVDYEEVGSSRQLDADEVDKNPRKAFADKVNSYMVNDDMDQVAAVRHAAEMHPDLYDAYRRPPAVAQ